MGPSIRSSSRAAPSPPVSPSTSRAIAAVSINFVSNKNRQKQKTDGKFPKSVSDGTGIFRPIFTQNDASRAEFKKFEGRNCRYAFLADCSKPLNSYVTYPDKIRALRFLGSGETGHCCSIGFSTAKYIRVLDLGESSLKKLPPSIGQLKLLGHLNAPRIKDQVIPRSITKLSKLMYLSLHGSDELSALPESFGEMEALMYLDLSGCKEIKNLPESFGKLGSLIHLDLSGCHQLNGIPEALCSLTKLQHLNLSRCIWMLFDSKGLYEVIGKLTKLRYLNLSGILRYRSEVNDNVLDKISTLSNLEHLDISVGDFATLPDSFCSLRKLQTLDLTDCLRLEKLPTDMNHMESLKFLIGCRSMTIPINKFLIPLPEFVWYMMWKGNRAATSFYSRM